jgi:hypothetical protein
MKQFIVSALSVLVVLTLLTAGQATAHAPLAPAEGQRAETALDPSAPATNAAQTFTYQGRLTNGGAPVDDLCDFQFGLWDALTNGLQKGITSSVLSQQVNAGLFTATINAGQFGSSPFDGDARWLAIAVRCPAGSGSYAGLSPRQALTAVPYALGLRFPFKANVAMSNTAMVIDNSIGNSLIAHSYYTGATALEGRSIASDGDGIGVFGYTNGDAGIAVYGFATNGAGSPIGVDGLAASADGVGVRAENGAGSALFATSHSSGIHRPTVKVQNTNASGISIFASQNSSDAALVVTNEGSGDLIKAFGSAGGSNLRFRVTQTGTVYADGSYLSPAADFAEMLPGVAGLEPGDVLVIGPDGRLTASSEANQASVAGVYSTQPGFVGNGRFVDDAGYVPLAIAGVVPVKVSAENGLIAPGDLLVASATPGHAMRADPIEINGFSFYPGGIVIGKALEAWEAGTGVIQVLVILQ